MRLFFSMVITLLITSLGIALTINDAEFFINTDPGAGNGTPVTVTPGSETGYYLLQAPVNGLNANRSHRLCSRFRSEEGLWSMTECHPFFLLDPPANGYQSRSITRLEYWFDNQTTVSVDIDDGELVNYAAMIPTGGLSHNSSHKFSVRYIDQTGKVSGAEARYFFLHQAADGSISVYDISHVEYWIDDLPHTLRDIGDAVNINFTDLIPHSLSAGPHFFRLRYRDERGFVSQMESRPFFVWTGAAAHASANIAGMELWVNQDPGVGNGLQIAFPVDGTFDEQTETVDTVLTGIPTGIHRMGVRFRDELGVWSFTLIDTFVVGPVLVVKAQGNDIRLDWIAELHAAPFHIHRATETAGPYTEIAQTDRLYYTDIGATTSAPRRFYYVTWTQDGLSPFSIPHEPRRTPEQ